MDRCKFCQEELEEGSTVCPHCGKDNAPGDIPEVVIQGEAAPEETAGATIPETTAVAAPAA